MFEPNIAGDAGQERVGEDPGRTWSRSSPRTSRSTLPRAKGAKQGETRRGQKVACKRGGSPAKRAILDVLQYDNGDPWRCRCTKCKELVTAYAEFIRRFEPFEWFINAMTFQDVIHPEQANRRYRRFFNAVNEELFGRRWDKRGQGVYSMRATEYQRRKVLHYHALVGGGVYTLKRKEWEDRWQAQDAGNGFLRIYPYDPTMGGTLYIAKYVSKGGEVDLFLPRWLNKKLQRELSQEGLVGIVEAPVLVASLRRRAVA